MSRPIIEVENLGKCYTIRHERQTGGHRYRRLSEELWDALRRPLRRPNGADGPPEQETFWALKGVSFTVQEGEVLGIIGRNGAGKSTLLKILSRITEPSEGRVVIRGRVASLLEVGTGFHPELTGRENIYLNGAILGMSRAEIDRKFDEIVAFAEVEKFLDTPVKRYSSGMYVRLAFAVAAHLEPEILVVDEVLAVGDAEFQKRCLGKMGEVAKSGRTVLFVSHNMAAVEQLCSRALFLADGALAGSGETSAIIEKYLARGHSEQLQEVMPARCGHLRVSLRPQSTLVPSGEDAFIVIELQSTESDVVTELALLLYTLSGQRLAIVDLRELCPIRFGENSFTGRVTCCVRSLPLVEGTYALGLFVASRSFVGDRLSLSTIEVAPGKKRKNGPAPYNPKYRGFVELDCKVTTNESYSVSAGFVGSAASQEIQEPSW